MHFSLAILAAITSTVSASLSPRTTPIPPPLGRCGTDCIYGDVRRGGCFPTDFNCLCHSQVYVSDVTACIANTCQGQGNLTAGVGYFNLNCQRYSTSISVPTGTISAPPFPGQTGCVLNPGPVTSSVSSSATEFVAP